jgi:RNA polymerase subunit RPABC4/transcription elongation factor Spt4
MPEIQIPNIVIVILQILLAFGAAFLIALWVSMIIWTFRDVRSRSRDVFAILLATLMVVVFGPLGLLLYLLLRPKETLAEIYERSLEEEALLQDLEQRAVCPGCRRRIADEWQVCPDCHTILKKTCLNCGQLLHLRWNICPYCASAAVETPGHDDHRHDEYFGEQVVEEAVTEAEVTEVKPLPPTLGTVEDAHVQSREIDDAPGASDLT